MNTQQQRRGSRFLAATLLIVAVLLAALDFAANGAAWFNPVAGAILVAEILIVCIVKGRPDGESK